MRAKTSATTARLQPAGPRRDEVEALAREYLVMAAAFLRPAPASLVAVGGLSGSGKSTVARAVAPDIGAAPGALVLRSDVIRKSLLGAQPSDHLGHAGYSADVSARVYAALAGQARTALRAGHAVVADAAFLRPADRAAIEAVAADAGVPFTGLWLEASPAVLTSRVEARVGDASDADAGVVLEQLRLDPGPVRWPRLDASAAAPIVLSDARSRLPRS